MFDYNLLFTHSSGAAVAVTTTGNSTALAVEKTPASGVDVEIVITAVSGTGTPTMTPVLYESDDDSTYYALATWKDITATGRYTRRAQSKRKYLRLTYTLTGTSPSFTTLAGIVSGPQRDHTA